MSVSKWLGSRRTTYASFGTPSGTNFGVTTTNTCADWTSNAAGQMGAMAQTQYAYSSMGTGDRACNNTGHLLCVETGRNVTVAARPNTGKLAFSTKSSWTPGAGLADADARCGSEAASAGLSGTFLAALATTTQSIADRFPSGQVYRRVDDVRILRTAGAFTTGWFDIPLELDQLGAVRNSDVWSGATRFDAVPSAAENCNDWMDSSATSSGKMHFTTRTDVRTPAKSMGCNTAVALFCFEQ